MFARLLTTLIASAIAAAACLAADPAKATDDKPLSPKEALKARMRAEGKKQPATASAPSQNTSTPTAPPPATEKASKKTDDPANTPPTVLPKVEVRNSRITELDQQVAKQELAIAREKENTKPSEADRALNDPKISKILSIFGGESSQHRAGIAQERVSLMEAEKDILEAMKTARTKEEKAELQKQLDELKAFRRELEKSLR